ncbi:MAG: phosphoglycerate kinase [Bacteroidota bacterium]
MKTISFQNKKVLIRVDFNVPLNDNGQITDDTRMRGAMPTLKHILDNGGSPIVMSHLGRPQKKLNEDGTINKGKFTLKHLVDHLAELSGAKVHFASDCIGEEASNKAAGLQPGEILLLENTRFHKEESKGNDDFARQLASLGDIFINDAFGTAHRAHASTTVVARFFSAENRSFGLLMEKELHNASKVINNPSRPLTAIIGGAKVSDKILLLDRLIEFADNIIVGGGMAYTFIKAQGGEIGKSLCEDDRLELAKSLMTKAEDRGIKLLLPEDSIIADEFSENAMINAADSDDIPEDWMGLDIGPEARNEFEQVIMQSKTILWNGPMGVFEMNAFSKGTKAIANSVAIATSKGAFSLIGGGDSVAAINQLNLADEVSYVSTGGGAMLEFLEGKLLPGVAAIQGD